MAATANTDANGNGPLPPTTTYDVCGVCGTRSDVSYYCQSCTGQSCTDIETSARRLCQSCWQQHQLDVHLLARSTAAVPTTSSAQLIPSRQQHAPPGDIVPPADLVGASTSLLRPVRPRLMTSSRDEDSLSSLLGGLVMHAATGESSSSWAVSTTSSSTTTTAHLLAAGLHDPSSRRRRLVALQAPISRQYEGWLWQALNNGGFEQAVHNIDERKQQIGVNLQSTLRDMEFRLERARSVVDEFYREYMRQVIEVTRCQMEALQAQSETLQRVRAAASRLQHARVYNDNPRALLAEADLASALRHNAASTCLRPCDDAWIEFRSPSDEQLRAYLRSSCAVDSGVHAAHCTVHGDANCLSWTVVGRVSEFDIQLRNHCQTGV